MQVIGAVVEGEGVFLAIESELALGNAVGISAWDRTVVGVVGIYRVEGGIIVSEDNISQGSIAISVRNE